MISFKILPKILKWLGTALARGGFQIVCWPFAVWTSEDISGG